MVFNIKKCPCCSNKNLEILDIKLKHAMRSDGLIINEALKKSQCYQCGLLIGLNSNSKIQYLRSDGKSNGEKKRSKYIASSIEQIIKKIQKKPNLNLIEIGGGSFRTSIELKNNNKNYSITSIEPNPENFPKTKAINLVFDKFEKVNLNNKYDVCYSAFVLEHVDNLEKFILKCKKIITDDGLIIFIVPNSDSPSKELMFSDHKFHFTLTSIKYLTNRLGLILINEFIPSWDKSAHIYILKKIKKIKTLRANKTPFNLLFKKRMNYYDAWIKMDKLILSKVKKHELILFGAGEISQLIACYLPETFHYIKYIVVDNIKGIRKFNKKIYRFSDVVVKGEFFLIGALHKNKKIIKTKLTDYRISAKNIIDLNFS